MTMDTKTFDEKVSKCDDNCKHFYVHYYFKDNTEHYQLHCNTHKFLTNIPRDIAVADIHDGAIWITKGDPLPPF